MELLHLELTDSILKAFFEVYHELGYGFLEKVYQNSMFIELKSRGFEVEAKNRSGYITKESLLAIIMQI